ncbi:MAG: DMT family transporter [Actinomycetota bacterium]|nr:EamA family transporter [Actinomycetota bacterium]
MTTTSEHISASATTVESARPDAITLACFAGVVLIAGINPVAVRFSNQELAPFWGAGIRFAVAAVLLFAIAAVKRLHFPRGRALVGTVLYGLFGGLGAYAFLYLGLAHLKASLAAPIMASVPLITFFLALAHRIERFHWRGLAGGVVSLAGIAVLSGVGRAGHAPIKYLLCVVAAAVCASEAGIVVKKFPPVHPIMMNALAMVVATAGLMILTFVVGEHHAIPHHAKTWWSLGFLTIFGSVVLFVLFVNVVTRWTVTGASYQFVLFPLVAVLLASWIAHEHISASLAAGAALVLAGVYVGALSGRRTRTAPSAPC